MAGRTDIIRVDCGVSYVPSSGERTEQTYRSTRELRTTKCCLQLTLNFLGRAELVQVVLGDLRNFQQPRFALVVNDGTALDIRFGLVGDLHDVFGL